MLMFTGAQAVEATRGSVAAETCPRLHSGLNLGSYQIKPDWRPGP